MLLVHHNSQSLRFLDFWFLFQPGLAFGLLSSASAFTVLLCLNEQHQLPFDSKSKWYGSATDPNTMWMKNPNTMWMKSYLQ